MDRVRSLDGIDVGLWPRQLLAHRPEDEALGAQGRHDAGHRVDRVLPIRAWIDVVAVVHHDDVASRHAIDDTVRETLGDRPPEPVPVSQPPAPPDQHVASTLEARIHLAAAPPGMGPEGPARPVTRQLLDPVGGRT